jgi:hypothetical protein
MLYSFFHGVRGGRGSRSAGEMACGSRTVWSMVSFRPRDRLLDEHRFRSLRKLVIADLDRIADVDNVGN